MAERRESSNQTRLDSCGKFKRAVRLVEDETRVLERQSGSDVEVLACNGEQYSKCIYARSSNSCAVPAFNQLRQPDEIIEKSSNWVTYCEVTRSREPSGLEFR